MQLPLPISEQETVDLAPPGRMSRLPGRNPCYVLSGLCMLAGCFLVSQAAHIDPEAVAPVFGALGVLVLYELFVIALVIYLAKRVGQFRDAGHLLVIEALLLTDVPLIYNELFLARPLSGGVTAALGLAFAFVKFGTVSHCLGARQRLMTWLVLGGGLTMSYGLPGLIRWTAPGGFIPDGILHGLWWCVGLLIATAGLPVVWEKSIHAPDQETARLAMRWRRLAVGAAVLSAAGHLLAIHYAFGSAMDPSQFSPVLLGLGACAAFRATPGPTRGAWSAVTVGAVGIAALLSMVSPTGYIEAVTPGVAVSLTPMRWALFGGTVVLALLARRSGIWWWLPAASFWLAPGLIGPDPAVVMARVERALHVVFREAGGMVPRTATHWGFVLMLGALLLLIYGGAWSMLAHRRRHYT